jgi:hypothetical protein
VEELDKVTCYMFELVNRESRELEAYFLGRSMKNRKRKR